MNENPYISFKDVRELASEYTIDDLLERLLERRNELSPPVYDSNNHPSAEQIRALVENPKEIDKDVLMHVRECSICHGIWLRHFDAAVENHRDEWMAEFSLRAADADKSENMTVPDKSGNFELSIDYLPNDPSRALVVLSIRNEAAEFYEDRDVVVVDSKGSTIMEGVVSGNRLSRMVTDVALLKRLRRFNVRKKS